MAIKTQLFYEQLLAAGIDFFTGVPDSLLQSFCAYLTDHAPAHQHVTAVNEGTAIGLAAGHYLATGRTPLVYMQNAGLGNAINPLTSLADPSVAGIPMMLLIGWRGKPGGPADEPQHIKMGRITLPLLDTLGIAHQLLDETLDLRAINKVIQSQGRPFAFIVQPGDFLSYALQKSPFSLKNSLSRETALKTVLAHCPQDSIFVSTTGKLSRELAECADGANMPEFNQAFLNVGAMGHTSQIALGIALAQPDRSVFCLDGDGAALMHLGGLATIGTSQAKNFKHVIFNNGAHESVGGQSTSAFQINLPAIARGCGYPQAWQAQTPAELNMLLPQWLAADGPALLEILIEVGSRPDLGRPKTLPQENKCHLMQTLLTP